VVPLFELADALEELSAIRRLCTMDDHHSVSVLVIRSRAEDENLPPAILVCGFSGIRVVQVCAAAMDFSMP